MTAQHGVAMALASAGVFFCLVAVVGILRLPDLFTRMHAASKAGTLGTVCTVLGAALSLGEWGVGVRGVLIIIFMLLTAPVAAHMIARAVYTAGATAPPGFPPSRNAPADTNPPAAPPSDTSAAD